MIHVKDLSKYYQNLCAVDHINLDIHQGEILALLGPNGAGKTTTLRMLTGFLSPTTGSIRVKDLSIEKDGLEIKKLLGYLPESAPLYHDMLVYDYLEFVAQIRELGGKERFARLRHLAELCGLTEVMHRPIGELSKGFKQRVGLAHAMMNDPEILILDEPTSGLDPNQIIEIRDIIREIGTKKTVILSTHILSEAEATCDRVVIINRGKIAADSSTQTLKESVGDDSVIHLTVTGSDNDAARKTLAAIPGVTGVAPLEDKGENDPQILRLGLTCRSSDDMRGRIYEAVKKTDWILLELYQETKSLEHIFREVTKES